LRYCIPVQSLGASAGAWFCDLLAFASCFPTTTAFCPSPRFPRTGRGLPAPPLHAGSLPTTGSHILLPFTHLTAYATTLWLRHARHLTAAPRTPCRATYRTTYLRFTETTAHCAIRVFLRFKHFFAGAGLLCNTPCAPFQYIARAGSHSCATCTAVEPSRALVRFRFLCACARFSAIPSATPPLTCRRALLRLPRFCGILPHTAHLHSGAACLLPYPYQTELLTMQLSWTGRAVHHLRFLALPGTFSCLPCAASAMLDCCLLRLLRRLCARAACLRLRPSSCRCWLTSAGCGTNATVTYWVVSRLRHGGCRATYSCDVTCK